MVVTAEGFSAHSPLNLRERRPRGRCGIESFGYLQALLVIITQSRVVAVEVIEHTKFYPHSSTIPPCVLVPPRRLVDRSRALATHVWSCLV